MTLRGTFWADQFRESVPTEPSHPSKVGLGVGPAARENDSRMPVLVGMNGAPHFPIIVKSCTVRVTSSSVESLWSGYRVGHRRASVTLVWFQVAYVRSSPPVYPQPSTGNGGYWERAKDVVDWAVRLKIAFWSPDPNHAPKLLSSWSPACTKRLWGIPCYRE